MKYTYKTKGTCSVQIIIDMDDDKIVRSVEYLGGCNGNTTGVSKLCEGMGAREVIERLKGIKCGFKATSCPDQLACAIENALKEENN